MNNFSKILAHIKGAGLPVPERGFEIKLPDAKQNFIQGMEEILSIEGKKFVWLPEYEQIVDWLANSDGKGLFMYGNCGRGKSLIARYFIPAIVADMYNILFCVTDAVAFAKDIDTVLKRNFVVVDDIGCEDFTNEFGAKRLAVAELMDLAEKHRKTVILTTNLNVEQLREKYGDRTVERIISTCRRVCFKGESQR